MLSRITIFIISFVLPLTSAATPPVQPSSPPPGKFTVVEDQPTLEELGLAPGPAWCYDLRANAAIITAPARERAHCELKLMYELEKQRVKCEFESNNLKLRLDTLTKQQEEINIAKDKELERLTEAVLKRPNDNNIWWGIGGFTVGTATTILIGWLIVSANSGFGM